MTPYRWMRHFQKRQGASAQLDTATARGRLGGKAIVLAPLLKKESGPVGWKVLLPPQVRSSKVRR